jgi:DNA polymerase kappa
VGGKNSVLCTANYEARKYGLRAAMPSFIALELCPHVVLFEPNFEKYKHFSNIFRTILSAYDPEIESHGLDEAYVDLTNHVTGKTTTEI